MFDNKTIEEKLNLFIGEKKEKKQSKIDWDDVTEAAREFAKEIFDEVDEKKIKGMVNKVKEMKPEDTEEAIGMIETMMRN